MKEILIIADIEGSSGCGNYKASSFLTREWAKACVEMSRDTDAAVRALLDAGVEKVTIQDFHRTGYNLLPELIDRRARIIHGYHAGKVYGIGNPGQAEGVIFLGLHAASGSEGFLPHTLTSRISRLEINGRLLPEIELFASSLAPFGTRPLFFSGDPVACSQAKLAIPEIVTYEIDKKTPPDQLDKDKWRKGLTEAVKKSVSVKSNPYNPAGPFDAAVTLRDGKDAAEKIRRRWKLNGKENQVFIKTDSLQEMYYKLIQLAYLTPLIEKTMPLGLWLSNLQGRLGLAWVRRVTKN